ncbi:MAG: VanZ family protein [Solirubrobacterales bacterium]
MSAPRRRVLLRSLAPLALMGAIFYLSAQPADADQAWWTVVLRKLGHVGGYATLTALWTWALAGTVRRPLLNAAAISFVYACSDEYHQSFVGTRHGSPVDVAVDAIGIGLAYLILKAAKTERRKDAGRPAKRAHLKRA